MRPLIGLEEWAKELRDTPRPGNYATINQGNYITHWPVAGQHRDSDALGRANWQDFLALMEEFEEDYSGADGEEGDPDLYVEGASHWLVGWSDTLFVRLFDAYGEVTPAAAMAYDILTGLEDYPVINDETLSQIESDELDETLLNCYDVTTEQLDECRTWLFEQRSVYTAEELTAEIIDEWSAR